MFSISYNEQDIPSNIRQRKAINNNNKYLLCNLKTIIPYQKLNFQVRITVFNYQATQTRYQVLLIE